MRARNAQDVSAVCSQALYVQSTTYTFHVRRYNDALYHTADHSVGSTLARSDKYLDVLFFTRRAAQTCSTGEITMLELFHGVGHVTHRPEKFGLIIKYEEEHAEVLGAAQIEDSFLKKCHSQRTLVKLL